MPCSGSSFAFQSTHNTPLDITDTIRLCWNNRLTAPTSVILAGMDFWTLLPMQEYMNNISACVIDFPSQGTQINILLTFRRHTQKAEMRIPAQWSFKRLILHVLGIDHHASRTITCGNNTIGVMHIPPSSTWRPWTRNETSASRALSLPSSSSEALRSQSGINQTMGAQKNPTQNSKHWRHQHSKVSLASEGFYATITVVTADNAKQNLNLGIPHPGFVTKIPIRKEEQLEHSSKLPPPSFHMSQQGCHSATLSNKTTLSTCWPKQMTASRPSLSSSKNIEHPATFTRLNCQRTYKQMTNSSSTARSSPSCTAMQRSSMMQATSVCTQQTY